MSLPEYIFADMFLRNQGQGMWETVPFYIHPDSPKYVRADLCVTRPETDRLIAEAVAAERERIAAMIEQTAYTSNADGRSLEPVSAGLVGMDMHHATIAAAIRGQS